MIASTKTTRSKSILARLFVSLTIGLLMLGLFAGSTFAASRGAATYAIGHAPVVATGGGVTLNEDCDDEDDDECESGGGLPATDTAPELTPGSGSMTPTPLVAILLITGLVGGAVKVASKRGI